MNLVKFEDGTYGIHVVEGNVNKFIDLFTHTHKWVQGNEYFYDSCRGTKEKAQHVYDKLNRKPLAYEVVPYGEEEQT